VIYDLLNHFVASKLSKNDKLEIKLQKYYTLLFDMFIAPYFFIFSLF